jgi:hypothetical protein
MGLPMLGGGAIEARVKPREDLILLANCEFILSTRTPGPRA